MAEVIDEEDVGEKKDEQMTQPKADLQGNDTLMNNTAVKIVPDAAMDSVAGHDGGVTDGLRNADNNESDKNMVAECKNNNILTSGKDMVLPDGSIEKNKQVTICLIYSHDEEEDESLYGDLNEQRKLHDSNAEENLKDNNTGNRCSNNLVTEPSNNEAPTGKSDNIAIEVTEIHDLSKQLNQREKLEDLSSSCNELSSSEFQNSQVQLVNKLDDEWVSIPPSINPKINEDEHIADHQHDNNKSGNACSDEKGQKNLHQEKDVIYSVIVIEFEGCSNNLTTIQVPALGRKEFQLGALYDARSETISRHTLWKPSTIEVLKKTTSTSISKSSIWETNSLKSRANLLSVSNISALMLWCKDDVAFLNDAMMLSNAKSMSLLYEKITEKHWIPFKNLKGSNLEFTDDINLEDFTHVVVEVECGDNGIFEIQASEYSSPASGNEIQNKLKGDLEELQSIAPEVKDCPTRKCHYYGDFDLKRIPCNYVEFAESYSSLKNSNEICNPLRATLIPLKSFGMEKSKGEKEFESSLIDKCFQRIDELILINGQLGKLVASKACEIFPSMLQNCERVNQLILEHQDWFKKSLIKLLPKLYASESIATKEIEEMLNGIDTSSPFSYNILQMWLNNKQTEIDTLETMVNQICKDNSNLEVWNASLPMEYPNDLVCVNFEVKIDSEDNFINCLEKKIKSQAETSINLPFVSNIIKKKDNSFILQKYYQDLLTANNQNKICHFSIQETHDLEIKDGLDTYNIILRKNGDLIILNSIAFTPFELKAQVLSHSICKVSWFQSNFPSFEMEKYSCILSLQNHENNVKEQEISKLSSENRQIIFKNLSPSGVYKLEVTPNSHGIFFPLATVLFVTPSHPNSQKVKTTKVGDSFVEFCWNKFVDESLSKNVEKYQISLNEVLCSGFQENVRIQFVIGDKCSNKIEGLTPNTTYQICVSAVGENNISLNESSQYFHTTDKEVVTLRYLWNYFFSIDFDEAGEVQELMKVISDILNIKQQKMIDLPKHKYKVVVLQLISSVEFKLFVKKFVKTLNGNTKSAHVQKINSILLPLNIYEDDIYDWELKLYLYFLMEGGARKSKLDSFQSPTILNLISLFCENNETDAQFPIIFSKFLLHVKKKYSKLQQFLLYLMLQKYDIDEKNMVFGDLSKINIAELLFDLVLFEKKIFLQVMPNYSAQVNYIKYAMKYSDNKKEDFRTILSMFSNRHSDIVSYMTMFLSQWEEPKIEEFMKILETKDKVLDFLKQSKIKKDLFEKYSKLRMKKVESEETFNQKFLEVSGKDTKENFHELSSEIFKKLNFEKYLKDYLSRQDVYSIENPSENFVCPPPMLFLKKLLMLDYRCRFAAKFQENKSENLDEIQSNNDNTEDFDDIFAVAFSSEAKSTSNSTPDIISNADIVLAAVFACDPFLIQDVFEKLAACQLAVPVIFSNPKISSVVYNLWALKAIKKKWQNKLTRKSIEANVTSYSCKTISFCRSGQIATSKSKVANIFLSNIQGRAEHSFFLNCDNDNPSLLNDGNIEVCWYTPEGSNEEHLHDLTCFYNLRGDAREHPSRFDFLLNTSNVLVIFTGKEPLSKLEQDKLKAGKAQVILVQTEMEGFDDKPKGKIKLLFSKGKTISSVAEHICRWINVADDAFKNADLKNMETHAKIARDLQFAIDEDSHYCKEGKRHALQFIQVIDKFKLEELKEKVVPLQGYFWQEWAKKDKEEVRHKLRSEKCDPQSYSSELREQKKKFREQQMQRGPSEAMMEFLQSLLKLPKMSTKFFLHFIQLYLNNLSECNLPKILESYNQSKSKLNNKKKDLEKFYKSKSNNYQAEKEIRLHIEELIKTVKSFSKKFDVASFGIEHIFREIAQIYESFSEVTVSIPDVIDELPKIIVELMLEGYPLEIMDGNVSHIPITWLKRVFLQLKKTLKNAKIYVVSILGIQSSGKSTFLNTMHGCKFPVSSGRCTKGVFVQIIPVKEQFKELLKCDYYLLMDTEGLRSPELGESFHHDNEIATLISCLANLTIINFWGQTFSKDMADVIQIAALAYIRMEKVKIKSSFHMIFAGVHDITAAEKNEYAVSQTMEEINSMIEKVAKSEGRIDLCRGLKSIFPMLQESYENVTLPQFLPVLWHSSMSPPESRYGELTNNLKISVTKTLSDVGGYRHVQTIQEFINRLKDIWEAIKKENFVFGFRNSQSLEVYNQMHLLYEDGLTEFREMFFKEAWPHESKVNDLIGQNEKNADELISLYKKSIEEYLYPLLEKQSRKVIDGLQQYIATLSNPDLGMMHLDQFEMRLENNKLQLLENDASRVANNISVQKKSKSYGYQKQIEFKRTFLVEARKLAIEIRNEESCESLIGNEIIYHKFEGLYKEFLIEAKKEDMSTFDSQKELFSKLFAKHTNYLQEKVQSLTLKNDNDTGKHINEIKAYSDFCQVQSMMPPVSENSVAFVSRFNYWTDKTGIIEEAICELQRMEKEVRSILSKTSTSSFRHEEVLSIVMGFLSASINSNRQNWRFKRHFSAKVFANAYTFVVSKLKNLEIERMKKYSLVAFLEKEKDNFKEMFIDDCTTADIEVKSIEDYFKFVLLPSIILRLKRNFGRTIYDYLIKIEVFSNKKRMFYEIEKGLVKEDASAIIEYSQLCEVYVKKWIIETVGELSEDYIKNELERRIEFEKDKIMDVLKEVDAICKKDDSIKDNWYMVLEKKLKAEPMEQNVKEESTALQKISNASFVMEELIRLVKKFPSSELFEAIVYRSQKESESDGITSMLEWFEFNPLENLFKDRLGCTAQCPFCGVKCASDFPCTKNQRHKASMHRPEGLTGRNWVSSRKLVSDICTFAVGSDCRFRFSKDKREKYSIQHTDFIPYKEVREIVYDWDIPPIFESKSSEFWQYLFVKNQKELAEHWNAEEADFPSGWNSVEEKDAINSLKETHGINE